MMPDTLTVPQTGGDTTILERPDVQAGGGDHDKFAHYVDEKVSGPVAEAYINRTPLTALCGKVWTPEADPKKYAICPTCIDEAIRRGLFPKDQ